MCSLLITCTNTNALQVARELRLAREVGRPATAGARIALTASGTPSFPCPTSARPSSAGTCSSSPSEPTGGDKRGTKLEGLGVAASEYRGSKQAGMATATAVAAMTSAAIGKRGLVGPGGWDDGGSFGASKGGSDESGGSGLDSKVA